MAPRIYPAGAMLMLLSPKPFVPNWRSCLWIPTDCVSRHHATGQSKPSGFTDIRPCRAVVPPFYNEYALTHSEPGYAPEFEEAIMLFRPLFGTSFLMQSYCEDHAFHGAKRVIVTSASAKTAMGFGYLMNKNFNGVIECIGLTSAKNRAFVESLECYDQVLTYDEIDQIDVGEQTIIFDVAGNSDVVAALHQRLGETIPYSGSVGKTHWDAGAFGPPHHSRRKTHLLVRA